MDTEHRGSESDNPIRDSDKTPRNSKRNIGGKD
ncbi:hypothetical protein PSPO01_16538 [Paraphaeosphaeria sporulosa]